MSILDATLAAQLAASEMRRSVPPIPTDRVRLHVALWNMARSLGLNWTTVDASKPDHVLVEEIATAVAPAIAKAFLEGYEKAQDDE